jgi:hypothetical protein
LLTLLCTVVEDLATDLSKAWWDADLADKAKLFKKMEAAGMTKEETAAIGWREIKTNCKVYVKKKERHAQCVDEVRMHWRHRVDGLGRGLWNQEADKVVDNLIAEILAGFYEGMCPVTNGIVLPNLAFH